MNVTLDGTSLGGRVVLAIVLLSLCTELLGNELGCIPQPEPMTLEACHQVCAPMPIRRMESWACECEPWKWEETR